MELSLETEKIVKNNYGFRNNYAFGMTIEDYLIQDILDYEINELENVDMDEEVKSRLEIKDFNEINSKLDTTDDVYGFWLATSEKVVKDIYYGNDNLSKIYLPEKFLVISDLGYDGALFASTTPLRELKEEILKSWKGKCLMSRTDDTYAVGYNDGIKNNRKHSNDYLESLEESEMYEIGNDDGKAD